MTQLASRSKGTCSFLTGNIRFVNLSQIGIIPYDFVYVESKKVSNDEGTIEIISPIWSRMLMEFIVILILGNIIKTS